MLYCDLCNYYKSAQVRGKEESKCMCELTGFVFHLKPEEYDMENYPCFDYEIKTRRIATVQLRESLTANFGTKKPA